MSLSSASVKINLGSHERMTNALPNPGQRTVRMRVPDITAQAAALNYKKTHTFS